MKRPLTILLICLLMFTLASCGSGDTTNDKKPTNTNEAQTNNKETETKADKTSISVNEQVIYEANDVIATLKSYNADGWMGPEFKILVENNSDKSIYFQCDTLCVNGYNVSNMLSIEVSPGKKANGELVVSSSDSKNCGIEVIKEVTGSYYIMDANTYYRIGDNVITTFTTLGSENYVQKYDDTGAVIVDQDGVRVIAKKMNSSDSFWGADIFVYVENNTEKDLYIQCDEGSIDGFMVTPYFSAFVSSGMKTVSTITFMQSELEENDITDINNFEAKYYGLDANSYYRTFETDFINISFE